LNKSRLSASLPVYGDDELRLATSAWTEVLTPVATDWLNECYVRAMRQHDPARPFTAAALLEVWYSVQRNGEFDASRLSAGPYLPEGVKVCPNQCSDAGFYVVRGNGSVENPAGYEYVKACPIHRPEGFKKDPRCAPWNGQTRGERMRLQ
jgi:hypothetical protein